MDFIRGALILTGLLTIGYAIIGTLKDCGGTEDYYNPCTFEVGQEIETVAYERSANKYTDIYQSYGYSTTGVA